MHNYRYRFSNFGIDAEVVEKGKSKGEERKAPPSTSKLFK